MRIVGNKLTEKQWEQVFLARCRSKQGEKISREENDLCVAAFNEDKARYSAMSQDVFNETVPFGSPAKYRSTP